MRPVRLMRKPFFAKAYLVTLEDMEEIASICQGTINEDASGPFIRVPAFNARHPGQTKASIGSYVVESELNNRITFKVYDKEWLNKSFFFCGLAEIGLSDCERQEPPAPPVKVAEPETPNLRPLPTQVPRPKRPQHTRTAPR